MAKEKKEKKEKKGKKDKEEKKKEKKEKKGKKGKAEEEESPEEEKKGKGKKKDKKEKPKKEKSKEKPKKEKKKKKKKGKKGEPEELEVEEIQEIPEDEEGKKKKGKKKGKNKKKTSSKEDKKGSGKKTKKSPAAGEGAKDTEIPENTENPEGLEGAEAAEEPKYPILNLSWAMLHLLGMGFMLCDSLWTSVLPAHDWLFCLGRMAFPIFAFLLVEGFFHTENLWQYLLRLLAVAVVSEIPFNLFYSGSIIYPLHQNVIWTFVIGLLFLILLDEFKERFGLVPTLYFFPIPAFLGYFLGQVLLTDYYGAGVLIILMFYLFHGKHWACFLGQLVCLWFINLKLLAGYYYVIPFLGYKFELIQQGLAVLSLIPIWLYYGRQGLHGKVFRCFCYLFYPVHLLILFIIRVRLF